LTRFHGTTRQTIEPQELGNNWGNPRNEECTVA
jgi:hypothetical protein